MGNGNSKTLMDTVIDVKMTKKQLDSCHKRSTKEEATLKGKVKKAIEQGNAETARIYAEQAIMKKNEALNFLKLAAKMDAVASRLESAEKSQQISKAVMGSVPQLQRALRDMNPEQMAQNMDQFEKIFEDLDVTTGYMTGAINNTTATMMPVGEVDGLIKAVGDEHALETGTMMRDGNLEKNLGVNAQAAASVKNPEAGVDQDLEARLAQLRG